MASGCRDGPGADGRPGGEPPEQLSAAAREALSAEEAERARKRLDAAYPKYAAVTGIELRVYAEPNFEATVVGWLRVGARVRLGARKGKGGGCAGGWYPIHPTGFVCTSDGTSDGLEVRSEPIEIEHPTDDGWKNGQAETARSRGALVLPPAARDEPLPYDYYFVKEPMVPSFHRLPSRNEQRAALAKAAHYLHLLDKSESRAARYLAGESDDGPPGTEVTARYLERGFFVASNGSEMRAFRRFVRTNKGRYIKQIQLDERRGHNFEGVALNGERQLPVAWSVRTARPLRAIEKDDGSIAFKSDRAAEPIERQTLLVGWKGLRRMQGHIMHVLDTDSGTRYLRSWFAGVAYPMKRPKDVKPGEPWIHVDTRQQTAVLYRGDEPVYATLVSTGIDGHDTAVGVFEIRRKRVTDTMANLGPEAGDDRYRVEDIPWTQYYQGSFALHAAFWHAGFGTKRSHGCVNLSPADAHRLFRETLPAVPDGWHGLSTEGTKFRGSRVVVTDEDLSVIQAADQEADSDNEGEADGDNQSASSPPQTYGIHVPANWIEPWPKRKPKQVIYTVQRGSTARFVANLFGLFHSEMKALNPDVDLDATLGPDTELVVYRHDAAQQSRSLGYPNRGSLKGGVPLPDGEGRILKATPNKMWATRRTVAILDAVLRAWPRAEPHADPLLVGNLSLRKGGRLQPHHTHQSGRDVDLGYPQIRISGEPYNWRDMNQRNLDVRRTWRLLHLLQATGELEVVLMDRSLQKLLYRHARDKKLLTQEQLSHWLEYRRSTSEGSPLVQHAAGHIDHLHVRFTCGGQAGCKTRRD